MKPIALASDHAGFQAKEAVKAVLRELGIPFRDYGTHSEDSCDYPDFAAQAARAVSEGESERAILACGSGTGMAMVANKFPGVRAAACHDEWCARMSRMHNDANVLALGGRVLGAEAVQQMVRLWLDTPFEGGRHSRRVAKIADLERCHEAKP
ncbi:MAG: ribose 5-phosphate isomerase B [Candidatus Tectomicrobia bacterium]|uniref:Ribose 5-phosphate isomerase B n=1 Tax=Tectimicrobiota bacterium TaxID=2528274 RepID=A0A932MNK3_UNCTE|nr:ribose 5-phosphate isomerase B [Candidatus Tectomicrobia bacterium]